MPVELLPVKQCDPKALVRLERMSFTSDLLSERSFRRLLRGKTADGQGAYLNGDLIGYSLVLFRSNSRGARIYSLAVDPAVRGRGVGRQLLSGALDIARARGAAWVTLEVGVNNPMARSLYESLGFRVVKKRKGYYEDGGDALVYRCDIQPSSGAPGSG